MPRIARVVLPDYPHHVIQRGNRSQKVFFHDEDKKTYLDILRKHSLEAGLKFWAYCLMDNHVHLIAVPMNEGSLMRGIGEKGGQSDFSNCTLKPQKGYYFFRINHSDPIFDPIFLRKSLFSQNLFDFPEIYITIVYTI